MPGNMLLINTHSSDFNTVLAVYTGSNISSLTEITSNDDAEPGTNTSKVVFSFAIGETYHIAVDGKTINDTGNIILYYEIIPEPVGIWIYGMLAMRFILRSQRSA